MRDMRAVLVAFFLATLCVSAANVAALLESLVVR